MEKYKEKVKSENIKLIIYCVILALFSLFAILAESGVIPFPVPVASDSHWQSKWRGFVCGAAFGLMVYMIIALIRNLRALRNDSALKKLYIKENDERTAEILRSAQAAAYRTLLSLGLIATIIAGYFSVTVSLTILICIYVGALLGPLYKLYYNKKF